MLIPSYECAPDQPSSSSANDETGRYRLQLRAHRRRHRHRSNYLEHDQLFDLLTQTAETDKVREKIRRNKNKAIEREKNEALCGSERKTVHLNSLTDEYDPPFIVEIRCQNLFEYEQGLADYLAEQKCVHGLLRCVQRYGEIHVSRRPVGHGHWVPHTIRDVPVSCECMWPVDQYGHQEL
ncbi:unnamed protein product [Auanema sp. JU1783]|nr:unnamed protein product [Auanema sp. JU1783]